MIALHNLEKYFLLGTRKVEVFNKVNYQFKKGKIYSITGASGCGKSTLLSLIAGLDRPTSGTITVEGKEITKLKENALCLFRSHNIGFVFQQHHLIRELTVLENILLPSKIVNSQKIINAQKIVSSKKNAKEKTDAKDRAMDLLEKIQLQDRCDHLVGELSGGEMQRANLARALINNPPIILADEPTGNLDEKNAKFIFSLLKKFSKEEGATILIATHSMTLAKQCDQSLKIENQKITR